MLRLIEDILGMTMAIFIAIVYLVILLAVPVFLLMVGIALFKFVGVI